MELYRKKWIGIGTLACMLFAISVGALLLYISRVPGTTPISHETILMNISPPIVPEMKIERKVFGNSEQGKPIEGYVIGSGENTLLLFAAIHGNEMGTTELLRQLVLEISLNPNIVSIDNRLVIIPVANPDGYNDRVDNLNANGVNLNLNFATSDWKKYGPEGTYAGEEPFSQIESRVLQNIVEQYQPDAMISFHSHGNLISPESTTSSKALALWYAERSGYAYFDEWNYPGTATKWFEETTGKPAITVEIAKDLHSDWEKNKSALFALIAGESLVQL